MVLQPTTRPGASQKELAHFFSQQSSNTLILAQQKEVLQFSVHGRNEVVNHNTSLIKKIRNLFIAQLSTNGLSKIQWQGLCDGIIQ